MAGPGLLFAIFGYRFVVARVIAFYASWKWKFLAVVHFAFISLSCPFMLLSFPFVFLHFPLVSLHCFL